MSFTPTEKQLRGLNPLAALGYEPDAESAISGDREMPGGRCWFVRRGCVYNVKPGMLPGNVLHVRDLDENVFDRFYSKILKEIASNVLSVLQVKEEDCKTLEFTRRRQVGTEFFISSRWFVETQVQWAVIGSGAEERSNLVVNLFVMDRTVL